jgi:hypothetical protein
MFTPQEEIERDAEELMWETQSITREANRIRLQRDSLLCQTDWTQAADIPQTTKDKWISYRQALRDVPQQSSFPLNIVWPTPPQ